MCAGLGLAAALAAEQPVSLIDGRAQPQPPAPLHTGQSGELSVTILETPAVGTLVELRLQADTVQLPENRLGWEDVVDPQARNPRIRARIVAPSSPGEYVVRGRLSYVTCSRKTCRPKTANVTWLVTVVQPPPAQEPGTEDPEDSTPAPDAPAP